MPAEEFTYASQRRTNVFLKFLSPFLSLLKNARKFFLLFCFGFFVISWRTCFNCMLTVNPPPPPARSWRRGSPMLKKKKKKSPCVSESLMEHICPLGEILNNPFLSVFPQCPAMDTPGCFPLLFHNMTSLCACSCSKRKKINLGCYFMLKEKKKETVF